MGLSIVLIGLGTLAIFTPTLASPVLTPALGWLTTLRGVILVTQGGWAKPVKGQWLNLMVGMAYGIVGFYIVSHGNQALVTLTLAFGILFLVDGGVTLTMGFVNRSGCSMSWLIVLNGITTMILGILISNSWPFRSAWLMALYLGLSLLFNGTAWLATALVINKDLGNLQ